MEVIIDGIRHCPVTDLQTNIGIAITTHNRPAVLAKTIEQHLTHLTAGAKLIVIDDGSAPAATAAGIEIIRHEKSLGIVASKNRSIEELIDADKRRSDYITIDRHDSWRVLQPASQRTKLHHPELEPHQGG